MARSVECFHRPLTRSKTAAVLFNREILPDRRQMAARRIVSFWFKLSMSTNDPKRTLVKWPSTIFFKLLPPSAVPNIPMTHHVLPYRRYFSLLNFSIKSSGRMGTMSHRDSLLEERISAAKEVPASFRLGPIR